MQEVTGRSVLPQLTGVRAIAAYLVFFHHLMPPNVPAFIVSLSKEFHTGVTIFFVLSGFLIYLKYSGSAALSRRFLLDYYRNRIARIYPVYFLLVAGTALFLAYSQPEVRAQLSRDVLLQLTFVRGFSDQFKFVGVTQGWTLTVEECFYALFPLLVVLGRRVRNFWAPLLAVYAIAAIASFAGDRINYLGYFTPARFVILYTFVGRAAEFFVGMFLAREILEKPRNAVSRDFPVVTTCGMAGFAVLVYAMSLLRGSQYPYGLYHPLGMIINNLILPVFVGLFFYGLITERSIVRWLLASKPAVLLGKSSYVFYLIHLGVVQSLISSKITPNHWLQFPLLILTSLLIYFAFEEPCRRAIRAIPIGRVQRRLAQDRAPAAFES